MSKVKVAGPAVTPKNKSTWRRPNTEKKTTSNKKAGDIKRD